MPKRDIKELLVKVVQSTPLSMDELQKAVARTKMMNETMAQWKNPKEK
jgi:hypothetical protein